MSVLMFGSRPSSSFDWEQNQNKATDTSGGGVKKNHQKKTKGPQQWERGNSTAVSLLGEQHDIEAESKLATEQRKINTAKLKPVTLLNLVCYFKLMYFC